MASRKHIDSPEVIADHQGESTPKLLTPLQDHYLRRLEDLIEKRADLLSQPKPDSLSKKLLARAIYATLMDCLGAGCGDQAQAMLDRSRSVKA